MDPVAAAVWFIEANLTKDLNLGTIAEVADVSRFHLVRAFGCTKGASIMRYVRGRRLTQAARALAGGAPDILAVALDAGYGSHEAFTRAFRSQFGLTPDAVRAAGSLDGIKLVEALPTAEARADRLERPRFETPPAMLIAGLCERYTVEGADGIPALWQRLGRDAEQLAGRIGDTNYGICFNTDDAGDFDYLAGVQVDDFSGVPKTFARLRIAPQRYAVFTHRGHISSIRGTLAAIWNEWLPASGFEAADAPFIERLSREFDIRTGQGGLELWLPVR